MMVKMMLNGDVGRKRNCYLNLKKNVLSLKDIVVCSTNLKKETWYNFASCFAAISPKKPGYFFHLPPPLFTISLVQGQEGLGSKKLTNKSTRFEWKWAAIIIETTCCIFPQFREKKVLFSKKKKGHGHHIFEEGAIFMSQEIEKMNPASSLCRGKRQFCVRLSVCAAIFRMAK